MRHSSANKIVVDWGYGANDASYIDARLRVDAVSKVTAKLLNFLISNGLTTHDKVIITGHSLGKFRQSFLNIFYQSTN